MGGGEGGQTNPGLDQIQQQQQYAQLGKTLTQSLQGAGASIAGANAGLSGQVSAGDQQPVAQAGAPQGPYTAATGPLFAQQGMGSGGIDEQQLAQILRALGYGGA